MDSVVKFLQPFQLHPQVNHFSVALLIVAVLIDLVASLAPTRIWLRYTALTLMILAVWRILIQVAGFMAGSRMIYLIVAIVAIVALGYQSHLGGSLVFDYGTG